MLRTLRIKDFAEARTLHAKVAAEVDKHWQALRSPAETLTNKQAVALAGVFYRELTTELSNEPGTPTIWEHWLSHVAGRVRMGLYARGPKREMGVDPLWGRL